jgi:predicted nucleic acid-binding protein
LKLIITDQDSCAVEAAIKRESLVVISPLTELEVSVQLRGRFLGGLCSNKRYINTCNWVDKTISNAPFVRRDLVSRFFSVAITQHAVSSVHCRSLDRLHLAAMAELGVKRLMTHDVRQADGARELSYEVVMPGG